MTLAKSLWLREIIDSVHREKETFGSYYMLCSYFAGFILVSKSIGMKRSKWYLMDPNSCTEGSDVCPLICGCVPSACAFLQRQKGAIVL